MNPINEFLKNNKFSDFEKSEFSLEKSDYLSKINQLFFYSDIKKFSNLSEKTSHTPQKHQIWSVKNEYLNYFGKIQETQHPFIVLLNSDLKVIENEKFVRVNVISPFIEMASKDDILCEDSTIIGFPFLLEIWNDQPILTDILDEYIGDYIPDKFKTQEIEKKQKKIIEMVSEPESEYFISESVRISTEIVEFRQIEISRAKYINHSVTSLLSFLENKQFDDFGVSVLINDIIEYPKISYSGQIQEPTFSIAAKTNQQNIDRHLILKDDKIPFVLRFRKFKEDFLITVTPNFELLMFNSENREIKKESYSDKTIFSDLKSGLYTLKSDSINKPLKIRLN